MLRIPSGFLIMLAGLCVFVWESVLSPINTVAPYHEDNPANQYVSMVFKYLLLLFRPTFGVFFHKLSIIFTTKPVGKYEVDWCKKRRENNIKPHCKSPYSPKEKHPRRYIRTCPTEITVGIMIHSRRWKQRSMY